MEESAEANMETDVTSTTEDGPETQEVTGSNGNVQMVIVVEKVEEEEMSSSIQTELLPLHMPENSINEPKPSEESPQKVCQPEITAINSPIKDITGVPSPKKAELLQQVIVDDLENHKIESVQTQQVRDADSSIKELSPIESLEETKSVENRANKVQIDAIESNPNQNGAAPVQESPTKELLLNDSTVTNEKSDNENFINGIAIQSCDNHCDSSSKTKLTMLPINITVERDTSNDSQLEAVSTDTNGTDISEKEHNKSISRELKSLINSAKESKIISECTQITSKRRKSISGKRSNLDTSSSSLNNSLEADKIQGIRRNSNNSQKSSCSEKSEKVLVKRSMRSQNPEFVTKVKQFLSSVTGKHHKESEDDDDEVVEKVKEKRLSKHKIDQNDSQGMQTSPAKLKKLEALLPQKPGKIWSDLYCWRCHWVIELANNERVHSPAHCTVCPRSFHYKCLTSNEKNKMTEKAWVCPECIIILQAQSSETRSQAMKKISLNTLCDLFKYALERMMDLNGVEPFMQPVDRTAFPDYDKYVVHPMDLSQMRLNISERFYESTEAFIADAQWILHNSIIFNTLQSKLTAGARALVRSCRAEMGEIEACPECYSAAHARKPTWFTDVCTTPHILLWAKLKGFPYWPAKGMSVSSAGHVDVRFFGAHDRAWVPAKDCYLYSEKDPNNFRTKRQDIVDSMQEAEEHIRNISRKYGKFVYPPFKTQLDPTKLTEQLKMMIPAFEGELRMPMKEKTNTPIAAKKKSRSLSTRSCKSTINDGDTSETEESQDNEKSPIVARKMADEVEISKEADDSMLTDISTSVTAGEEPSRTKTTEQLKEFTRKRRRSELEEAVITIMDTSNKPPVAKRRRSLVKPEKEKKKSTDEEPSSSKEIENKLNSVPKAKDATDVEAKKDEIKGKDNELSSSAKGDREKEKSLRVTPIRIAFIQKDKKHNLRTSTAKESMAKIITPHKDKDSDNGNAMPSKQKPRTEKYDKEKQIDKTSKEDKLTKSTKRRNSRNNRSLSSTPKSDKSRRSSIDKRSEKTTETSSSKESTKDVKEKAKENNMIKDKETDSVKSKKDNVNMPNATNTEITDSVKDRSHFDDDTSLAVIARDSVILSNHPSGFPTIISVRSLSTTVQNTSTTISKTTTSTETIDMPPGTNSASSTCSQNSTDSAINAKESTTNQQKAKNDTEHLIGRVGVRAFARMTSPEKSTQKNDDVHVEIKAEPIDVDDADRQIEKLNLMNAFKLRPVNPPMPANNLKEVRLNKVIVTPITTKKGVTKAVEVRPRAKKSFPQPKKSEDGQLNSKNSMVYIPIQPPMTQAPVRPPRVVAGSTCPPVTKPMMHMNTSGNSLVNTITTPVMTVSSLSASQPASTVNTSTPAAVPGLGQVPAAVHTVPLMTSVNGQWMFSLQPIMSVGALETTSSPAMLNGVAERSNNAPPVLPLNSTTQNNSTAHNIPSGAVGTSATKTPAESSTPGEPPRLQQRPSVTLLNPLDPNAHIGKLPTPSNAGPVTAKLNQNAVKLTDFFRALLEDSIEMLEEPATQVTSAKLQLEHAKWKHQLEIEEIKHNHELTLAEMRTLFEKEKLRVVAEARRAAQAELEAAVKATKAKQWCANCSQEAQFYCCWNTAYCDYPCQRAHWSQHHNVCTQKRRDENSNGEPPNCSESRLQPQPDNMPALQKSTATPALTVGGKLAPPRYNQDQHNTNTQKNAIIVSMVEDQSGNQTMKCVGTYKPPVSTQNISPVILNKQIMNNEENSNKKVVSTGGYLIVGGGTNSSAVVTPARRGHTIQYFT